MSNNFEQDHDINLDQAITSMQKSTPQSAPVEPVSQQQEPVRLGESYNPPHVTEEEPEVKGIIINNADLEAANKEHMPQPGELTPETQQNLLKYLESMDDSVAGEHEMDAIFKQQKTVDEFGTGRLVEKKEKVEEDVEDEETEASETEEETDPEESAADREERFEQAVVIIDKLNSDKLKFSEEEKEKLEYAKSIKVKEVETLEIRTLKTKKKKKNDIAKIIKRLPSVNDANIVLPSSGYTAKIAGASAHELISLMTSSQNALLDAESKWSLIHSKLVETSLGNMTFTDFLRSTASSDYNTFIYGLLMATYPDDDKVPFTCENEKCKHSFQHTYSVRSLLRAEEMSEKLQNEVKRIVDGSHTEEDAKKTHADAAVNQVLRIVLPETQIILDLHVQSAHELINNSIKSLVEHQEEMTKYAQATMFATLVKTAYVPDPDSEDVEDPEYYEYTSSMDITKIIYALPNNDFIALSKKGEDLSNTTFEFGLMNVRCPKCGHIHEYVDFDIESILFYRYQQSMNTSVE